MQHKNITMFKKSSNEYGQVRCVISDEYKEEFTGMGFVDHVDKLKSVKKRSAKAKTEKVESNDSDKG